MSIMHDRCNASISDRNRVQQLVVGQAVFNPSALNTKYTLLTYMITYGPLGDTLKEFAWVRK